MEKRADSAALAHDVSEGVYANALEKLYRVNHLPAVTPGNRQTHPHLYDRMLAAKITPTYLRPRPPRRMSAMTWFYAALVVTFLILGMIYGGSFDLL